jgi:hypothetical protein
MIIERDINVMFLTEIISIEYCSKHEKGYYVTLFNADGLSTWHTDWIIETTTPGWKTDDYKDSIKIKKSLCAMLVPMQNREIFFNPDFSNGISILKGCFKNEYVLKFRVNKQSDWIEARNALNQFWISYRNKHFPNCEIASVATAFAYDFQDDFSEGCPVELDKEWDWIPSASFNNMLAAIEGGVRCFSSRLKKVF